MVGWITTALLLLMMPANVQAQYSYTTNADNTITITGYTGGAGALTITNQINGITVTSIGDGAFGNCETLTNVTIPNSITNIGNLAFYDCQNLDSLTIPDSVTTIGYNAFSDCYSLLNVMISSSITNIGLDAFNNCVRLTNITVDAQNSFYSSQEGVLFDKNQTTLIQYAIGKLGSYRIPDNVVNIGFEAFAFCANLTSVTMPNSTTSIGQTAFFFCDNLASILIPASVTSVGMGAFDACSGLTGAYFKGNAPSEGFGAFNNGGNNTNVIVYYLPWTTGWGSTFGGAPTMPWYPYNYMTNNDAISIIGYTDIGASMIIPDTISNLTVTSIGTNAFFGCTNLTSITIAATVTNIGDLAFSGCTNLVGIYFQGNAPKVGSDVFLGDNNVTVYHSFGTTNWSTTFDALPVAIWTQQLTVVANPSQYGTVTGSGTYAVGTNVQISATASSGWPFTSWSDGSTNNPYTITMSATNITYTANFARFTYTVDYDNRITITGYTGPGGALTIPIAIDGLTISGIGNNAFRNCTNRTSVTIPNSVTSIGESAFRGCLSLTNIAIPDGVISIGDYAFQFCGDMTSISIPNRVTDIGEGEFYGCTDLTSVTIPDSVTSIGYWAFCGCSSLTNVIIGNSVTSIVDQAFDNCGDLTSVYFKGNAPSLGGPDVFSGDANTTIYYMPWTTGWSTIFGGRPTVPWIPYNYRTNNGAITITGYTGFGGAEAIPSVINSLSVTGIGSNAFSACSNLTSVIIPNSVTNIGTNAFFDCTNLISVVIGNSVTNIGNSAFSGDSQLTGVYFRGNAPRLGGTNVFFHDNSAIVYYLALTTGWGSTFGGRPTVLSGPAIDVGIWSYKMQLSFPGYDAPETLTNFPALVVLSTNLSGFSYKQFASTKGYDLRFASLNGSINLNYEIEQWNTNGNSCVWVQVPQLSTGCYIWAYWGNTNISVAMLPAGYTTNGAAWDANAFAAVWHMGQANTLDSTANRNNGTAGAGTGSINNATGIIGSAQSVSGGGHVTIPDSSSLDFSAPAATYSAWVCFNTLTTNGEQVIMRREQYRELGFDNGNHLRNMLNTAGRTNGWTVSNDDLISPAPVTGQWYYVAFTYDGSVLRNFWNGVPLNAGHTVTGNIQGTPYSYTTGIGAYNGNGDAGPVGLWMDAIIDEVRAEQMFRSTNWIWATYLTVASNTSFICYGSVEPTDIPPSAWIKQYFPGTATNNYVYLAESDADDNGMTVWQEYVAGINPTNPNSCFSIAISNLTGKIVVSFPSFQTNSYDSGLKRYYDIEQCTNLTGGSWQPAPGYTNIVAKNGVIVFTNKTPQNSVTFYRAKARLE
jgi:hypothetical protein